jgi:mono/diheme cytochrome c family protein
MKKNIARNITILSTLLLLIVLSSCTKNKLSPGYEYMPDMYRSPSYETYSKSTLFADSLSALKPVKGTIPRFNAETLPFYEPYSFANTNEGYEAAGIQLVSPISATSEVLAKGEQVYKNFCIHCHGVKGDGLGILVERDKYAGVPSYYSAALKDLPEGKMYHSIYYGKNMMGSHASQINSAERWAVVQWVKKLRDDGLGISNPSESDSTKVKTASL